MQITNDSQLEAAENLCRPSIIVSANQSPPYNQTEPGVITALTFNPTCSLLRPAIILWLYEIPEQADYH